MIEINLVPDIKQEYLRSQSLRAKVISMSIFASLAAGGVVVLLATTLGGQAIADSLADNTIKGNYNKLVNQYPNLSDIVTIQNQLANVSKINDSKQLTSRTFELLEAINPKAPDTINPNKVTVTPSTKSISIEATAENGFNAADAFKKTILNTDIVYGADDTKIPLADDVQISDISYGVSSLSNRPVLRFKFVFTYPEQLFINNVSNVRIVSPVTTIDVTDSKLRVPDNLFAPAATDIKEGE